jgi:hypothetical protein
MFSEKLPNIEFHENPSSRSPMDGDRQKTDRHDEAKSNFSQLRVGAYTSFVFPQRPPLASRQGDKDRNNVVLQQPPNKSNPQFFIC